VNFNHINKQHMSVSKEDFQAKIDHVGENLYRAHVHLTIHEKMTDTLNERRSHYPDFLSWSRMAHYETGVQRLTRAYDDDSLGISKVINIFQSNYRFWGLEIDDTVEILNKEIEIDKSFLESDLLIESLKHLRDKAIAHTDSRLYPRKLSFSLEDLSEGSLILRHGEITTEEIESLPAEERKRRIREIDQRLYNALQQENNTLLGRAIPDFSGLIQLSEKGIEVCNRYIARVGSDPIALEFEDLL
jgi:hypothetical protein